MLSRSLIRSFFATSLRAHCVCPKEPSRFGRDAGALGGRSSRSQQCAGLFEFQTWVAGQQFCPITVAEITEKIRFDTTLGKEFLFAALAFARSEEFRIHFRVIEP